MEIGNSAGGPKETLETVEDSLVVVLNLYLQESSPSCPEDRGQTRSGYFEEVDGCETADSRAWYSFAYWSLGSEDDVRFFRLSVAAKAHFWT
jgi:hypothetical protein